MTKEHNGIISFWKFAFSLLIVALHVGFLFLDTRYRFEAGSIGVDFFFIVSGFLFCSKCMSKKITNDTKLGKETFDFVIKKIVRFLPYVVFLWIISIPFGIIVQKYTLKDFVSGFYNLIYMPVRDNKIYDFYGITWYLAVLILVEGIFYPIIIKYKKNFIYYFSPLIVYLGMGYLFIRFGSMAGTWTPNILSYGGIIRGIVGINAGVVSYIFANKIRSIKLTDFSRFIMTIFEIIGYVSIFVISNKYEAHIRYDCLMMMIMMTSISISFSGKSLLHEFSKNKFFYALEKISLPIYINQWFLIYFVVYFLNKFSFNLSYYGTLIAVIVVSIIVALITEFVIKIFNKNKEKIKKIFVK